MIKFSIRHQGVISVFLSLILLPVFLFSSIIIDGTRVYSSQNMMSNAGDLTMNTALSDFDTIVKDVYGLLAMSDTPEEMSDNLEAYMMDMISREAGFDAESSKYTKNMVSQICQLFTNYDDVTYENIINIQMAELEAFGVQGSTLANSTVLENQIIEYMKYRGPVTLFTKGVLSKFSQLKGLDKQIDAIEAETEYQEQLADTGDDLENAYLFLQKYEETADGYALYDGSQYRNADMGSAEARLMEAFEKIYVLKYLQDHENDFPYWDPDRKEGVEKTAPCLWVENFVADHENSYTEDELDIVNTIIAEVFSTTSPDDRELSDYEEADVIDAYELLLTYMCDEFRDQNWLICNTAGQAVGGTMAEFIAGYLPYLPEKQENDPITAFSAYLEMMSDTENIEALNAFYSYKLIYNKYATQKQTLSAYDPINIVSTHTNMDTWYVKKAQVKGYVASWKTQLEEEFKDALRDIEGSLVHYAALKNAQYYLQAAKSWLKQAESDIALLDTKRAEWSEAVEKMDDGETKTNFAGRVSKADEVDLEELNELKNVINAYESYYKQLESEYEKFAYGAGSSAIKLLPGMNSSGVADLSTAIQCEYASDMASGYVRRNYKSVLSAKKAMGVTSEDNVKTVLEKAQAIKESYSASDGYPCGIIEANLFDTETDFSSVEKVYQDFVNSQNGLNFDSISSSYADYIENTARTYFNLAVNIPEFPSYLFGKSADDLANNSFYQKLQEWFNQEDKPTEESQYVQTAKNDYKGLFAKTKMEDTSANITAQLGDHSADLIPLLTNIKNSGEPSSENSSLTKGGSTSISDSTGGSDKENYKNVSKNATGLLSTAKSFLSTITDFLGSALEKQRDVLYVATYMLENFSCATTNLKDGENIAASEYEETLSGYTLDPYNNYLYRGELEYILWGDADITEDVKNTKALIYAVRFVLNTVYAFSAADIQNVTNPAATAIVCGLAFLQPLVNVVLTMLLAAGESALDLNELMKGNDVVLYKSVTTWRLSLNGTAATATKYVSNKVIDEVFTGIEDLADAGIDELTEYADKYVEQSAQSVKEAVSNTVITPVINKLYSVAQRFTVSTTDVENMVDSAVDEALDQIETTLNQSQGSGLILEAEKKVVSYLRSNKSVFVNPMVEYFNKAYTGSGLNATEKIEELKNKLTKTSEDVIDQVSGTITGVLEQASDHLKNTVSEACKEGGEAAKEKTSAAITNYMGNLTGNTINSNTLVPNVNQSTSVSNSVNLNYKEYLTIFLMVEIELNETVMLQRMSALIELNISKTASGKTENDSPKPITKNADFDICSAYTMMGLYSTYHINTLFLNSSSDDLPDFSEMGQTGGVTMTYQSVMGY